MANKESTAVNELVELMQSGKPLDEPGDELFRKRPPAPAAARPPRMTATIPPMRGAGEVAPLPRRRSANGTEGNGVPAIPPPVRVSTAPPSRSTTIPPIVAAPKGTPAPTIVRPPPPPTRGGAAPGRSIASGRGVAEQEAGARLPSKASLPPPARTSAPPSAPVAAPFQARTSAPIVAPVPPKPSDPHPFTAMPVAAPPAPALRPPVDLPGDSVSADNWFEASRAADKLDRIDITFDEIPNTSRVQLKKQVPFVALAKKLALPVAGLALVGVFVGGYFAFDGEGGAKHHVAAKTAATPAPARVAVAMPETPAVKQAPAPAPTPTPTPTPAPAPAPAPVAVATPATTSPAIHEVPTSRGVVKLVDVRVDSAPSGATVMLVDNGKTTFLGNTPVSASLDPARTYDVIVTLEGHPTQMAHVDPSKSQHLNIALGKETKTTAAAPKKETPAPKKETPAPAPKKVAVERPASAPAPAPKKEAPTPRKAPEKKVAAMAPSDDGVKGNGTLAIASKPPCEITIDGKSTGLTTPQRSIPLTPGAHKILLVNHEQKINKQFAVAITANQATKVIKDFLKQ